MSLPTIRILVTDLIILGILAVGGWFLGAELLADEAGPSTPIIVRSEVSGATTSDSSLVIPLSGLSPFGHPNGLLGRQVLVGRVTDVGEDFFIADTASGPATFRFNDDSTFLLRLARGSRSDIIPGVSVAILTDDRGDAAADGSVVARSILVLSPDVRPSVTGPSPLDFPQENSPQQDEAELGLDDDADTNADADADADADGTAAEDTPEDVSPEETGDEDLSVDDEMPGEGTSDEDSSVDDTSDEDAAADDTSDAG